VLVMAEGRVQQLAAPVELYREPATRMVAEFIGGSMVLPARLRRQVDEHHVEAEVGQQLCHLRGTMHEGKALASFRPKDLELLTGTAPVQPGTVTPARVLDVIYRGGSYIALVQAEAMQSENGDAMPLRIATDFPPQIGAAVAFRIRDGWLLPAEKPEDMRAN